MENSIRIRSARVAFAGALALRALVPCAAAAGDAPRFPTDQTIAPADGELADDFGEGVALRGERLIVGALFGDVANGASDSGSAYVYARSGASWAPDGELAPLDAATNMRFGAAVAIDGALAAVGAYFDDATAIDSGSAYVFERGAAGWSQVAKLVAFDGSGGDWFGRSIALSGDTVAVGAENDDALGTDSGSVYVFVRSGASWVLQAKLTASNGVAYDAFGVALALEGDRLVVGAPLADAGAIFSGAAYVFRRDGANWVEEAELAPSDPLGFDDFGSSVAFAGGRALVGAPGHHGERGAAYLFERAGTSWSQAAKLSSASGAPYDRFGAAVAIDAQLAAVGAPGEDFAGAQSGGAHLFVRCGNEWLEDVALAPRSLAPYDALGYALALDAGEVAVAGPGHALAGTVFAFAHASGASSPGCFGDGSGAPCPCRNESTAGSGAGCANSSGLGASLAAGGSARVSRGDLRLFACGLVPEQPALLFAGRNAIGGGAGLPFGDGLRCVGGDVQRLGVLAADDAGRALYEPSLAGRFAPGELHRFQTWYRDPAVSPCGALFNTSSALALRFGR